MRYFETVFLEGARKFVEALEDSLREKVLLKLRIASGMLDPKLFKKLRDEIWEFRVRQGNTQIRLMAFWDKSDSQFTFVIVTHGFFKKNDKTTKHEIEKAKIIRTKYFDQKE